MEKDMNELKSVLRSLVVSSPTQVNLWTLLRDYRDMMGAPIPLAKYGYKDALTFLKERCSDCFVFEGPHTNPILTLIVPDTLKHIDHFVQKQRISSVIKHKGKRRSIAESTLKKPQEDLIVKTFNHLTVQENPKPKQINKSNMTQNRNKLVENKEDRCLDKTSTTRSDTNTDSSTNTGAYTRRALQNFLRKRLPPCTTDGQTDDDTYVDKDSSKDDNNDSGRQTASSTNSSKRMQFEELKSEIKELIMQSPEEGLLCTDLMRLYRERYGRELEFNRFGFMSIVSVVCAVRGVHAARAPDGDWLLRAGSPPPLALAPSPALALAPSPSPCPGARRSPAARRAPRAAPRPAPAADPEDALPGIDFDPDVFPEDCIHFMESIPEMSLNDLEPGAMFGVVIGEVYSPSHFWLLRLGPAYHQAMDEMMDEMNEYYTRGEGRDRQLALGAVRVGHYCCSEYEGDWHRSLIVRVLDGGESVKVRHVDYGTVERAAARALRPLRRAWAALPAQAARARLAGVRPPAAGRRWPHAATAHFLRLVRDRRLVANVVALDRAARALELLLLDTAAADDVCIGTELVRAGHADARADSAVGTNECYLLPSFEVLESGATPNFGEIDAYLRDGIALQYVDEYRRHVPCGLPPTPAPSPSPSPSPSPPPPPSPPPAPSPPPPPPPPPPAPCPQQPAAPVSYSVPVPVPVPAPAAAWPHLALGPHPYPPWCAAGAGAGAGVGPPPAAVSLSVAQCEVFRVLSEVDPRAAQRYMLETIGRALSPPARPPPYFAPAPAPGPAPGPAPPAHALDVYAPVFCPLLTPIQPPPGFSER